MENRFGFSEARLIGHLDLHSLPVEVLFVFRRRHEGTPGGMMLTVRSLSPTILGARTWVIDHGRKPTCRYRGRPGAFCCPTSHGQSSPQARARESMFVSRDADRVGVRRGEYVPSVGWRPNGTMFSLAHRSPAHGVIPEVWTDDRLLATPIVGLEKRTRHVP